MSDTNNIPVTTIATINRLKIYEENALDLYILLKRARDTMSSTFDSSRTRIGLVKEIDLFFEKLDANEKRDRKFFQNFRKQD